MPSEAQKETSGSQVSTLPWKQEKAREYVVKKSHLQYPGRAGLTLGSQRSLTSKVLLEEGMSFEYQADHEDTESDAPSRGSLCKPTVCAGTVQWLKMPRTQRAGRVEVGEDGREAVRAQLPAVLR